MVFGGYPEEVQSIGTLENDVDTLTTINMMYSNNRRASITCGFNGIYANMYQIMGTKGYIVIESPFWCPEEFTVVVDGVKTVYETAMPETKSDDAYNFTNSVGLNFEAAYFVDLIREGKMESEVEPLAESREIMRLLDEVRAQIGLKYPNE